MTMSFTESAVEREGAARAGGSESGVSASERQWVREPVTENVCVCVCFRCCTRSEWKMSCFLRPSLAFTSFQSKVHQLRTLEKGCVYRQVAPQRKGEGHDAFRLPPRANSKPRKQEEEEAAMKTKKEREREREKKKACIHTDHAYIYIYIYIYGPSTHT